MIKYMIVDDHKIFRQGLRMALADDPKLKYAGEAGSGKELLNLLKNQQPDVLLLDIKMPEMDGSELIKILKEQYASIKILIITMFEDEQFILHFMEAGAQGYLIKNAEPQEIKEALHTVYETGYYFSDKVSNAMLKALVKKNDTAKKENMALSEREADVLKLICKEYTAAEIANELYLSVRTIEGVKSALIEKLKVRNTAGLIIYALKNNIV